MNLVRIATVVSVLHVIAGPALAGDATKGESAFKRCKACHSITDVDGTKIVKGGKTGPDLFGVIGRTVGSFEGFNFSLSMAAAGEAGLVWDEEMLTIYVADPKAWLVEVLDDPSAKSKMTFKLKKGGDDMAAYLATLGPS